MQRAQAAIYLEDDEEPIPTNKILSFEFRCGIEETFPVGVLIVNDMSGSTLSSFQGCAIGTKVRVKVFETSPSDMPENGEGIEFEKLPQVILCTLMVASVSETTNDQGKLSGTLELLLVHPWIFYQDYTNHLYKGITNSDIIKSILTSSYRGFNFEVDKDLIEKSDETGEIPRYKCGISDKEFILESLLPYTTINGSPPLFWIDDQNSPNLRSMGNLFSQKPESFVYPGVHGITATELFKKAQEPYENLSIFAYSAMKIKIGDEKIETFLNSLHSKVVVDANILSGGVISGKTSPKIQVSENSEDQVGNKLPIVSQAIIGDTDCKILTNRNIKDQTNFLVNTSKSFINLFRIEVTGNFCGDNIHVGNTVYLYNSIDNKKLLWTSGIWLVKDVRHYIENKTELLVMTTLVLCRPSFLYNKEATTDIPDIDNFISINLKDNVE